MKFKVYTEEELKELNKPIPEGIYDFQVYGSKDEKSKSGNEMITLRHKIWDVQGNQYFIRDWLVDSMAYKIKHFWDSVGEPDKYTGDTPAEIYSDKLGKLVIKHRKDKNTGEMMPFVYDYVTLTKNNEFDEKLPF